MSGKRRAQSLYTNSFVPYEDPELTKQVTDVFNNVTQNVRDKALRDAAEIIRNERVCNCVEEFGNDKGKWHDCCKYSEFAARNVERLIGTPYNFDGDIHEWEDTNGK